MLLTIGMIVKNEESNLEDCLTALMPILENVDSELIIADTGSTDRTVEIARQFTDNVFYFEWIKDFAAARNSTLEKAQGEWFMFVDGDEVFASCDEIIHFFNSGEYKKYNSASYIQRNYGTMSESGYYSDFKAPRLTKILPNTRFINPIHEVFNTYGYPLKFLNDHVDHYGYVNMNKSDEETISKAQRNYELLIKRLDSEPESSLLYSQLYDTCTAVDKQKSIEYLEKGLEYCRRTNDIMLAPFYAKRMSEYLYDKDFDSIIEISDRYYVEKKGTQTLGTETEITAIRATAFSGLGKYEEAMREYIKFFDLYKSYKGNKLNTNDMTVMCFVIATDYNFPCILSDFLKVCISLEKYHLASEYLKTLPIAKYSYETKYVRILADKTMTVMKHFDYADAAKYYNRYDVNGKACIQDLFRREIIGEEENKSAIEAFSRIEASNSEISAVVDIYRDFYNSKSVSVEKIKKLSEMTDLNRYPEMLYIAVGSGLDITDIISVPEFKGREAVCFCYGYVRDFHDTMNAYSAEFIHDICNLPAAAEFMVYTMKGAITVKRRGIVFYPRNVDNQLRIYADMGLKFCENTNDSDNIPDVIKGAVIADKIIKCREMKNYKDCIVEMRKIIEVYPDIAAVISEYRKAVLKEYEDSKPKSEMEILMGRIKENIRNFIRSGDIVSASKTLAEYEKINPSDPDIAVLKAEIQ